MKEKLKKILPWILVLVGMLIIFLFSNMNTYESNSKSEYIISTIIERTNTLANQIGVIDNKLDKEEINDLTIILNKPLRKCMHATIYLILSILILFALSRSNKKISHPIKLTIIVCFLYALTDEFHQIFIKGRTPQITDVLIDTLGAMIGTIIYNKVKLAKENKKIKS